MMQLLLCCLCMSSCSDIEEDRPVLPPDQDGTEKPDTSQDYTELISKTASVPVIYGQEAEHRGEVVRIDYNTRDYAEGTGRTRTNTAYVYLPYRYGENINQRYNVLYLVHGHYATAATTFEAEDGLVRKLLDHMTGNGDMAPTIVVSPSYNYGEPTPDYVDADPYCEALPQELVNDLIPLVESRYRTYAESTDAAGLEASREHRAIGGFSMGAVTTWYALEHTLAYFIYACQRRLLVVGCVCRNESSDGNRGISCRHRPPIPIRRYRFLHLGCKWLGRFRLQRDIGTN